MALSVTSLLALLVSSVNRPWASKQVRHRRSPALAQTLAYLLPTLSLAIARAEAEVEAAAAAAAALSRRQKRSGAVPSVGSVQAIVVAPSRELAMQIVRVAQSLLPPGARGAVQQCIGGANPHRQARSFAAGLAVACRQIRGRSCISFSAFPRSSRLGSSPAPQMQPCKHCEGHAQVRRARGP